MNNHIKKMLHLKDENLILTNVEEKIFKEKQTIIISGIYSPEQSFCHHCGAKEIVKNGKKEVTIRLADYQYLPTILKLKKQRFYCKNCHQYTTVQSPIVEKRARISRLVKWQILHLLKEKVSLTFIAKQCHVSITTVIRLLQSVETQLPKQLHPRTFPKVLMMDEFRSHASYEDKMSFICADGQSGELVDILPSRKLEKISAYFLRSPIEKRKNVEFLVSDMNAAYFQLTKTVFPNALLIIDRFHIVKHLNQAFNDLRVREMKALIQRKKKTEAKKLKSNWKILLKNQNDVSVSVFKKWRSFPAPKYPLLTEAMVIDRLLAFSDSLKKAYEVFQSLLYHFKNKDGAAFFEQIRQLPDSLDDAFKTKLQNLLLYEEGIRNGLLSGGSSQSQGVN